jgi:hypothetical protein
VKPEQEAELEIQERRINTINREIADLMTQRHKAEQKVFNLKHRLPNSTVVLAARHLDERNIGNGSQLNSTDASALRTVLKFVAAHRECEESSQ